MNQNKGAGHHAVTLAAVEKLFAESPAHGKLLDMDRANFFRTLDHWQEFADRWHPTLAEPTSFGDTWHSSSLDPGGQAAHSMADPSKSGTENLKAIQHYVASNLYVAFAAHQTGNHETEMRALGAAVHALEDSYSNAHMFRDPANPTDPYAWIQAINNFEPLTHHQTHESAFDEVQLSGRHLERPTDQAAAAAVAEMLATYMNHLHDQPADAYHAFVDSVGGFYQAEGVVVLADNRAHDYQADRLAHYQNELCRVWDHSQGSAPQPHGGATHSNPLDPAHHSTASGHHGHESGQLHHFTHASPFDPAHYSDSQQPEAGATDLHHNAGHASPFDPAHQSDGQQPDGGQPDPHQIGSHASPFDPAHHSDGAQPDVHQPDSNANMTDLQGHAVHVDF